MAENQKSRTEPTQNNAMLGSLRGNEYQILLTLLAVIKAGILMKQDDGFECTIAAEEQEAGKFDDVIFHNLFRDVPTKLNVQAKNRMSGQKISWKELVDRQAKGAFSITKYFISFMTTKQYHTQGVQHLVLCTNVDLDDKAITLFEKYNLTDACDIFSSLGATCYRLTEDSLKISKEYNTIVRLLKECSDHYNLSNLLAAIIYGEKELDLTANNPQRPDTAILYKYSPALNSLIGEKREKNTIHELQEKFITGSELSPNEMQFRKAFEAAYKLKAETVWEDVKAKGIKVKSKAKKQEGTAVNTTCSHFPEDAVTNEDIVMFFQQFVFVTNAKDLATGIKKILIESGIIQLQQAQIGWIETDAAFNYLYKIIHNWITQQSDLPAQLKANNVQHILRKINLHLQYLNLKNLTMEYVNSIKVDTRCIKNEPLMELPLHAFLKSKKIPKIKEDRMPTIFTFYSSYEPKISLLILLETLKMSFDYTDHPEFIFIESNKYIEHKQTLQEILGLEDFALILVIECQGTTSPNQVEREMIAAFQSLESKFEKKVVLVAQIQENNHFNQSATNSLVLEHFFEGSFQHILPHYDSVTMFGTDVSLSALMHGQDDVKVLLELMKEENRTMMRRSLTEEHYKRIEAWYIQRDFEIQQSPIGNAASKYSGEMKDNLFFPPEFDECNNLDWKSFVQCFFCFDLDVGNVRDFLNGETTEGQSKYNPPGVCEGSTTKVHIFLDEAGFGKTTYLCWLGGYLQRTNRTWWVIRFNSIDYSTDFKRLSESDQRQTMDDTLALRILYQMIHLGLFVRNINYHTIDEIDREREVAKQAASLMTISTGNVVIDEEKWKRMKCTPLQLVTVRFFAEQFNNRKLVILFDGFDEVVPHYKEVVYDLLSRFESFEGIFKMYITSRPYNLSEEFSKVFQNVSFYKLKPFSDKNILTMVYLFMKSEFEGRLESKDAEYFLEGLSLAIKYYLGTFSQVPLFIRMALDVLRPSIAQHVDFAQCTMKRAFFDILETDFEQLNLIEKFVENKIAKANGEKIQLTDSASNIAGARSSLQKLLNHTLKTHSILSLYVLFDPTERERLQIDELQASESMDEVNDGNENSGIIEAVVGDRPIFIHRTFAEYFAALWFFRNKSNSKVSRFLKSFSFWESNRGELRDFFDRMIIKQSGRSPIHVAILENASELVKEMVTKNPDVLSILDAGERSILHLLVLRCSTDILAGSSSAWKCDQSYINQKDAILQWSPLDYALITFDTNSCRDLLKFRATINTNQLIEIILSHDLPTILRKTFQYGKFTNELSKQCNTSKGALEQLITELQESVANFLFSEKIDLHAPMLAEGGLELSPLEYFVSKNDGLMVKALANRAGHFAKLLSTRQDRYVLLAFENKAIDVLQILIFELYCKVPTIVEDQHLCNTIEESVVRSMNELSISLFKLYCSRTNVEYVDHLYESFCYAYNFLNREEMFNPDGIDTGILTFLRTAFKNSKIDAAKRFLQVAKLDLNNFTYPFIVECMRECKLKDIGVHWECEEALQYLIDKTTDLQAIDQDGKTLLHIALENNCFRMAQYLIDEKNFSAHHLDETKGWNAFFYCLMEQSTIEKKYTLIAHEKETRREFFEYLMQKGPFDCIAVRDSDGRNALNLAVMNRHFSEAGYILEMKLKDCSPDDRKTLMETLLKESGVLGTGECDSFLTHFT